MTYQRDEQNFHVFLEIMRKERGVTLKQLADGICSESEMKRIEAGERLPEKLMRDRIMERLGVSSAHFEDYLQPDEYERMLLRQRILHALEYSDFKTMRSEVENYEHIEPLGKLEMQFIFCMKFYIAQAAGADRADLEELVIRAVEQTVVVPEDLSMDEKVLAIPEILLWAAYVNYKSFPGNEQQQRLTRLEKMQGVLDYIRNSGRDSISRAKIFPKVALLYCVLLDDNSKEELEMGLDICEEAIELLRKEAKLYYFLELLEQYGRITKSLSVMGVKVKQPALPWEEWSGVIKQLYTEYELPPRTDSNVHLFMEPKSYAIGLVIKKRREMYGLSRAQLCDGICSERTLMRIECMKLRTQMPIVRSLFERLGLNPDFTRSRVVTSDPEVLRMVQAFSHCMNKGNVTEGEGLLGKIEEKLNMEIIQNRQTILKCKIILAYMRGQLTSEEYERRMIEILELTVPLEGALKRGGYLTEEELMCILNIGLRGSDKDRFVKFLYWYCKDEWQEKRVFDESMTEQLRRVVSSYLGEIGEYDFSDNIAITSVRDGLRHRRCNLLESNIYCLLWNEKQKCIMGQQQSMKVDEETELKKCITLTAIVRFEKDNAFLVNKLDELCQSQIKPDIG